MFFKFGTTNANHTELRAMEALNLESRARPLLPKAEKPVRQPRRTGRGKANSEANDQQKAVPKGAAKQKAKAKPKKTK